MCYKSTYWIMKVQDFTGPESENYRKKKIRKLSIMRKKRHA